MTGRGGPIGLGVHLSVTAAGPATDMTSVAAVAPAKVIATSPTVLRHSPRRLTDGSRPPTPEGSQPPFGWDDVATPIRSITDRPSLAPSSFTRSPVGAPCGSLSLAGGRRAYHVPQAESNRWFRSRLSAGGTASAPEKFGIPGPDHVPFGPSLILKPPRGGHD